LHVRPLESGYTGIFLLRMNRIKFAAIPALFLLSLACLAQAPLPNGVTKLASVEGITEYRLNNGLRLLVFPDPSKSTITVNITYLVGSRQEGAGEGGMAHLLEHMLFKGSTGHTNIPQELTEHGARPNGTTDYDRTNYFETFQASDTNLKWALDLEADRMVNSFIKQEDFDKEFSVVRNEFEMGENNPFNVLYEHTMAAAYTAHSYGRAVIGNKSDVEHVPMENLRAFYHKFYQPDNAVLTVSGKVDEGQILSLVNEYFGKLPRPTRVLIPSHTVEPAQDGERMTIVRRVGDVQGIMVAYHVPDGANTDSASLEVLAGILGEESSGRLYKALVDNKKASQVFAQEQEMNEPGVLMAGAILSKTDSLDDARNTMLDVIAGVAKEPPSKEEVDRAKSRLLKQIDIRLRDSERVGLFLSEWLALGDWRLQFLDRDRIKAVTPDDVKRVATAYFKPSNRTIGEFIPEAKPDRAEIPAKTDVAAAVKDYKGEAAMAQGEAFDPSPKNVDSRTQRFTLASGAKVSLLSKKTRGASVHAVIALHFGTVENLKNKDVLGSLTASALIRGTTSLNRQQIQDQIDRLKTQLTITGGATGVNVVIETSHDNLPAVLGLAGDILKNATIPDSEFEEIKKSQLTDLEFSKTEPRALAPIRLERALYPFPRGDVRSSMTIEESIEDLGKATAEDARTFYKTFYGANHAEIAVVGDFDTAAVKQSVTALFGSFTSSAPYERIKNGYEKVAPVNETIETPDKANAMFIAGIRLKLRDSDPNFPGAVFGNYMLGGGFLNSRFATRIRVKDGLSYGVGSMLSAKSFEEDGRFMAYAIAAPQNVSKVEAAFTEELNRALKHGFTGKEIDEDRVGWLQSRQVTRSEDRSLAQSLATHDNDDRTFAFDEDLENKVRNLTANDINAAMRAVLDPAQVSIVKAGDFKKAAATTAAPSGSN
jgi:zinc protease